MADRLKKIGEQANPRNSPFLSTARAEQLHAFLSAQPPGQAPLDLWARYGRELLNSGQTEKAIEAFSNLEKLAREQAPGWLTENRQPLLFDKAMCQMRLGEQENCLATHSSDACLLPIRAGGVHKLPRGSRGAVTLLSELLEGYPNNLSARWLLNVAYMTLGEYPEKVSSRWVIPPAVFASDYDIKRFTNVASAVGLDVNELSGGSILEDFDRDGFLDVMVSSIGFYDQMRHFHNNGDGTFTEKTREAGLEGETGGLNILQADYNNDGYADVLVLRGGWFGTEGRFPHSLLRNNKDGTFTDVTEEAGVLRFHPTQTAVWFDYNNDGWVDFFVGTETQGNDTHPCELWRNNGDGTFTDVAAESGLSLQAFVKGVTAGDYNNDGRPDLYVSVRDQFNHLYRNDGPRGTNAAGKTIWKFTDVTAFAGVAEPKLSFPTWFFDYDNDGWLDLFVSGYYVSEVGDIAADYLKLPTRGVKARLYHNNRDGTFTDVSQQAGVDKVLLSMGSNFGDLDNDGFLDFYVGTGNPDLSVLTPNRMFRNNGGKSFQDVTTSGGFGHLQKGHGVSFGDIDNDGDQDIHEDMGGAYPGDVAQNVLYANPGHGNHWITLELEGVQSNRAGIGSRIKVNVETTDGLRAIYKTTGTGGSFGASPLRQEIGLGQAKAIRSIEIFWPVTGKTQVITNATFDHFYQVQEGQPNATLLARKSFRLPLEGHSHEHHHHE